MQRLYVVVLAAGQGTRMRSALPKVLHCIAGRPLLAYAIRAADALEPEAVVVVCGHGAEAVRARLGDARVTWCLQAEQKGTGHAVAQAMPSVPDDAVVLVLYGDVPLIEADTLRPLVEAARRGALALLTAVPGDPTGYGRIVRDAEGAVRSIVEHRDASEEQRRIREVNTGILAAPAAAMRAWLGGLRADNSQGEYYLTDVVAMALAEGFEVRSFQPASLAEVLGVNDRVQLAELERHFQRREAERLMRAGVTLADPARVDVRGELNAGPDVFVDVNVIFEGTVALGAGTRVGPNVVLRDCQVGEGCEIRANSVIEEARIGKGARIGPFARVRPGTDLGAGAHIGNFVEVKNSAIGAGSKVNHLSYIGDSDVGCAVNIGAGTITCNYDGALKHRTRIEDGVFVGSGVELVAPIAIGAGATIGAGSTLTKNAPAQALTVARGRQVTIPGWKRPTKKPG